MMALMTMEIAIVPICPRRRETTLRAMLRRGGTDTTGRSATEPTTMPDVSLIPPPDPMLRPSASARGRRDGYEYVKSRWWCNEATRPGGVPSGARGDEGKKISRRLARVVAALRFRTRRPGHPFPAGGIEGERLQHVSEVLRIVGIDEVAGLSFPHAVRDASHPGGDQRQARRERFEADERKAIRPGREHERVALRVEPEQFGRVRAQPAMHAHAGRGLDRGGRDQVELRLSLQPVTINAQEEVATLASEVSTDEQEARQAASTRTGTEERQIDSGRHHGDILGLASVILAKRSLRPLGPGNEPTGAPVDRSMHGALGAGGEIAMRLEPVLAPHAFLVERCPVGGEDGGLAPEESTGEERDGGRMDEERVYLWEGLADRPPRRGASGHAPGQDPRLVFDRNPARQKPIGFFRLRSTEVQVMRDATERLLHHETDARHPDLCVMGRGGLSKLRKFHC